MGEQRDYPKWDVITEPAGEHITQRGHSLANMKGQVLEEEKGDPFVLRARKENLTRLRHGLS